jgi:hypothetical protein
MSSSPPLHEKPKAGSLLSLSAVIVGVICCVMIVSTFMLPWYEGEYRVVNVITPNGSMSYQDQYGLCDFTRRGLGMEATFEYSGEIQSPPMERVGDLMSMVTIVLALSLAASILAAVLSYLHRRVSGVVVSMVSAGLLLAAGGLFYFGIIDALNLDSFVGFSILPVELGVEAGPMVGWWLAVTVSAVQSAQAVVLAYSGNNDV